MKKHTQKEHNIMSEEGNKAEQNTIKEVKLVHEEKDKELINSKIVTENNEFITEIPITENSLTDNIEIGGENPERDKQTSGEQDKVDKITKGFPLDNRNANKKLGIEFKSGKQASCAETNLTRRKTKQGNRNCCEENKLKKLI